MWPYEFPESFIKIQAVWYQCWLKGLEGIARSLERLCLILYHDDYTTIFEYRYDTFKKLQTYDLEAGSDGSFTDMCISHKRNF